MNSENHSAIDDIRLQMQDSLDILVSDYITDIIFVINFCAIGSLINIIGIVTNIINILVFARHNLKESINISLLGLSLSDLGSLVSFQVVSIFSIPPLKYSDLPIVSLDVAYAVAGWPRTAFIRITGWITAFISFERCICVVMPLQVKSIITPRRTKAVIINIFVLVFVFLAPTFYTSRLEWNFFPETNRTLLSLAVMEDREIVDSITFAINLVFLPNVALLIIIVCTTILAYQLNTKAAWRKGTSTRSDHMTKKDRSIVKMVTLISAIFIVSYFPISVIFAAVSCVPEMNIQGKYRNVSLIGGSLLIIIESLNSSINFFLYMKMSSKYRCTFNQMFCAKYKKEDSQS